MSQINVVVILKSGVKYSTQIDENVVIGDSEFTDRRVLRFWVEDGQELMIVAGDRIDYILADVKRPELVENAGDKPLDKSGNLT